uniref:Uncharacterized protein n=1 Tax=Knipowitschia caucasica TaxID=637954 RepID=A0AAV2KBB9_KNICA
MIHPISKKQKERTGAWRREGAVNKPHTVAPWVGLDSGSSVGCCSPDTGPGPRSEPLPSPAPVTAARERWEFIGDEASTP